VHTDGASAAAPIISSTSFPAAGQFGSEVRIPAEEPDEADLGQAWNVLAERRRDAVIQPPKPPIPAASAILARAAERDAGREAG